VDSEAPATSRDVYERVHEVWEILGQRGELVYDDEHSRHRLGEIHRQIGRQIVGAGIPEMPLPVPEFGLETAQGPFRKVVVEIRHHPDRVRELRTDIEGASPLVVDEHEGQVIRVHRNGEGADDGAKELGLPRPRRAGDEAVGAVGDEVDDEPSGLRDPNRRRQPRVRACRRPPAAHLGRIGQPPEQRHQRRIPG
jgi:hypothetical protein